MKLPETELPSNKKFGYFFTVVFTIVASYFYFNKSLNLTYLFGVVATFFILVTFLRDDLLLPLNRLWMRFGLLIGMIISPIVLGLIFFTFFSPVAIFMRILGRDELHLKYKKKSSYWILRDDSIHSDSFKRQF